MAKITIKEDVTWRGVTYVCRREEQFNKDGNLIKLPVETEVDVPADLAKILAALPSPIEAPKNESTDTSGSSTSNAEESASSTQVSTTK